MEMESDIKILSRTIPTSPPLRILVAMLVTERGIMIVGGGTRMDELARGRGMESVPSTR